MSLKTLKQRLRRYNLQRKGVEVVRCETKRCYGGPVFGWVLDPSLLSIESIVYSVGVGSNVDFDLALVDSFGLTVHAFDPTPRSIDWVKQQDLPENFVFHELGLAAFDGEIDFYPPAKSTSSHFSPVNRYGHQSGQVERIRAPVRRLESIARDLGHGHIDLLKMDIEGGEYEVLEDLLATAIPIRQLLIEFHHMFKTIGLQQTLDAIENLKHAGFALIHISERSYEFSFRR